MPKTRATVLHVNDRELATILVLEKNSVRWRPFVRARRFGRVLPTSEHGVQLSLTGSCTNCCPDQLRPRWRRHAGGHRRTGPPAGSRLRGAAIGYRADGHGRAVRGHPLLLHVGGSHSQGWFGGDFLLGRRCPGSRSVPRRFLRETSHTEVAAGPNVPRLSSAHPPGGWMLCVRSLPLERMRTNCAMAHSCALAA